MGSNWPIIKDIINILLPHDCLHSQTRRIASWLSRVVSAVDRSLAAAGWCRALELCVYPWRTPYSSSISGAGIEVVMTPHSFWQWGVCGRGCVCRFLLGCVCSHLSSHGVPECLHAYEYALCSSDVRWMQIVNGMHLYSVFNQIVFSSLCLAFTHSYTLIHTLTAGSAQHLARRIRGLEPETFRFARQPALPHTS